MLIAIICRNRDKIFFESFISELNKQVTKVFKTKYTVAGEAQISVEDAIFELAVERTAPDLILLHESVSKGYDPSVISTRCLYNFPNSYIAIITEEESLNKDKFINYPSAHILLKMNAHKSLVSFIDSNDNDDRKSIEGDDLLLNNELFSHAEKSKSKAYGGGIDVWTQSEYDIKNNPSAPKELIDDLTVDAILARKRIIGKVMLVVPSQGSVYGLAVLPAYPAIGVMSLASILEKAGHHVTIIDQDADEIDNYGVTNEYIDGGYNILGITSTTPTYPDSLALAKVAKDNIPDVVTLLGGIHATNDSQACAKEPLLDFVVIGEAECTAVELVDAIMNPDMTDYSNIQGLAYEDQNGEVVFTKARELTPDLDDYPPPAYHLVRNLKRYKPADATTDRAMPLMVSRGCPGLCTYCQTKDIFGTRTRFRSPDKVLEDVRLLVNEYGLKEIHFLDDVITANKRFCREFFSKLIEEPYKLFLQVANGLRADMVNEETLTLLRDAGLSNVGFGIETGSERVAEIIKKGISKDRVRKSVKLAKDLGLDTWGFFIIGLPGDDEVSVQETIDFAIELDLKFAKFLILKPFPGSEVYYQLNAKGLIDSREYSEYGVYTAPVHHLDTLSQERILELQRLAFRKFYFRPKKIFEHIIAINTIEKFKVFIFGVWFIFMRIFSAKNTRGRF